MSFKDIWTHPWSDKIEQEEIKEEEKIPSEENQKKKEKEALDKYKELTKDLPLVKKMIGYKAVDHNYCAFYGNKQKYEIGKEYIIEGELWPCKNGIHFCKTLENAMKLFPPRRGIRYLKVECEVPVSYYLDKQDKVHPTFLNCANLFYNQSVIQFKDCGYWVDLNGTKIHTPVDNSIFIDSTLSIKYVTKNMTVLEEVPFEQYSEKVLNSLITTEKEYQTTIFADSFKTLLLKKIKESSQGAFSDNFLLYWIKNIYTKEKNVDWQLCPLYAIDAECLHCLQTFNERYNAIKNENLSQDIKVLFMCHIF